MANPLDQEPLAKRQLLILFLAVLLAALDGFDAMSMAFVAPTLSAEWKLDKAVVGLLLSCGLAGMAVGSLAIAPLADRMGRRPVILGSLLLLTLGSLWSGLASSVPELAASRILTGIGIGTMIVMTTLVSAEFSNSRSRILAIASIATIGFPLGGVLGGLTASALLDSWGWHWVFLVGSIAGGILLVLIAIILPESPSFIISRRPEDALAKLNGTLKKLGHRSVDRIAAPEPGLQSSYRALFAPGRAGTTWRLIAINMLVASAAYYLLNWLPQLVADAGFSPATGSLVSAKAGMVGLLGGVALGALASRLTATRTAAIGMAGMSLALIGIGFSPPVLPILIMTTAAFSFFLAGATGTFYGVIAASFSSASRASGMGLVMGVGRISSAISPAAAGWMFADGFNRAEVSLIFAAGPCLAAILIMRLRTARS